MVEPVSRRQRARYWALSFFTNEETPVVSMEVRS